MVLQLCVPLTHRFVARNWNSAIAGLPFTASSVANRVGTSTPLIGAGAVVVIAWCSSSRRAAGCRSDVENRRGSVFRTPSGLLPRHAPHRKVSPSAGEERPHLAQ